MESVCSSLFALPIEEGNGGTLSVQLSCWQDSC